MTRDLLYKTYVRPQLEYRIQLWVEDIDILEKVQVCATKLVKGLERSRKSATVFHHIEILGITILCRSFIQGTKS